MDDKENRLELREQLFKISEQRKDGAAGLPAKQVSEKIRMNIKDNLIDIPNSKTLEAMIEAKRISEINVGYKSVHDFKKALKS